MGPLNVHRIGGNGGADFGHVARGFLVKIELWFNNDCCTGVRFSFSDGSVVDKGRGNPRESNFAYHVYTLHPGETFTDLTMWGNGRGTRFGGMGFKTSRTDWWACRRRNGTNGQIDWKPDIGSGLCVGVTGKSGWEIDQLGLVFLKSVERQEVVYRNVASAIATLPMSEMRWGRQVFTNHTSQVQTRIYKQRTVVTVVRRSTIRDRSMRQLNASLKVEVIGFELSGGLTKEHEESTETTRTEEETKEEEFPVTVNPHTRLVVEAITTVRQGTLPVKGTICLHTAGGTFDVDFHQNVPVKQCTGTETTMDTEDLQSGQAVRITPPPGATSHVHTVCAGDRAATEGFWGLAEMYGVDSGLSHAERLRRIGLANPTVDTYNIQPGQTLQVPDFSP